MLSLGAGHLLMFRRKAPADQFRSTGTPNVALLPLVSLSRGGTLKNRPTHKRRVAHLGPRTAELTSETQGGRSCAMTRKRNQVQ